MKIRKLEKRISDLEKKLQSVSTALSEEAFF
jgi:BMFP domain-containing protein YqiC